MKKTILILILILSTNVSALNDINISIDSGTIKVCLSEKNLINQTCNMTAPITLDGSKDATLYFTPQIKAKLYRNDLRQTTFNMMEYLLNEPLNILFILVFIFIIIIFAMQIGKHIRKTMRDRGIN